jgi:hypothetical protein
MYVASLGVWKAAVPADGQLAIEFILLCNNHNLKYINARLEPA